MKIIEIDKFLILYENDSVAHALQKLTEKEIHVVIVIDSNNVAIGILTGGDIVRILGNKSAMQSKLNLELGEICNRDFIRVLEDSSAKQVLHSLLLAESKNIIHVPYLSSKNAIIGLISLL